MPKLTPGERAVDYALPQPFPAVRKTAPAFAVRLRAFDPGIRGGILSEYNGAADERNIPVYTSHYGN